METNTEYFSFPGYEDLELSTKFLIRKAQKRQIQVEILDRNANFLRLTYGNKVEYVKQATITALDSYLAFACMEDKHISKQLLETEGLRVPAGYCFATEAEALVKYTDLCDSIWVLKPATSNYGIGISILSQKPTRHEYQAALDLAFAHADRVIIEEFISGEEYRFLVMGDECIAVCQRFPANVVGNGRDTIAELVNEKIRIHAGA